MFLSGVSPCLPSPAPHAWNMTLMDTAFALIVQPVRGAVATRGQNPGVWAGAGGGVILSVPHSPPSHKGVYALHLALELDGLEVLVPWRKPPPPRKAV